MAGAQGAMAASAVAASVPREVWIIGSVAVVAGGVYLASQWLGFGKKILGGAADLAEDAFDAGKDLAEDTVDAFQDLGGAAKKGGKKAIKYTGKAIRNIDDVAINSASAASARVNEAADDVAAVVRSSKPVVAASRATRKAKKTVSKARKGAKKTAKKIGGRFRRAGRRLRGRRR